jgi:hypothetical protein
MFPPSELDRHVIEPYDVPRGTCPRCGSGDVQHLLVGMPAWPESMDRTPDWVEWVGCIHPGHDRECDHCGLAWSGEDPRPARRTALGG